VALDPSFVGRSYPPYGPYPVSRAKITEFVDSIFDQNPLYRDAVAARAAGYADVIAPPTFVTIINLRMIHEIVADPKLGLDWSRVVHAEQTFAFTRPVTAGDSLLAVASIEDIKSRAGNDFLTVRSEMTTEDGEPVVVTKAMLVARGTA
jgi:acyl dehydratase